jgi:hypothetical protein
MERQRLIFLDFDGVIATPHSYTVGHKSHYIIDEETNERKKNPNYTDGMLLCKTRVGRLETICRHTSAQIVLSTTWRVLFPFEKNVQWLRERGLTAPVIDKTKDLSYQRKMFTRGDEILLWLEQNAPECTSWIAIDDDWQDGNMKPIPDEHLIKTYWAAPKGKPMGIGRKHIKEAIQKLE